MYIPLQKINPERMMEANTRKRLCKGASEKKNHGNKIFKIKSIPTWRCCFEKLLHVLKKFKLWNRHRWLNNSLTVRGERERSSNSSGTHLCLRPQYTILLQNKLETSLFIKMHSKLIQDNFWHCCQLLLRV